STCEQNADAGVIHAKRGSRHGTSLGAFVTASIFFCPFVSIDNHARWSVHPAILTPSRPETPRPPMNATPTKDKIIEELRRVKPPDGRGDIVGQGLLSEIVVQDGKVYFSIAVPPDQAAQFEPLRKSAERAAAMVPGVKSVMVTLTAEKPGI